MSTHLFFLISRSLLRELSDGAYQMMMLWEAIGETEKIIVIDIHHF
jgi:hypothetical protein